MPGARWVPSSREPSVLKRTAEKRKGLQNEVISQAQNRQVHALQLGALPLYLALENRFDVIEQGRKILRGFVLQQVGQERLGRVVPACGREPLLVVREAHFHEE